jgi:hypothetical protein
VRTFHFFNTRIVYCSQVFAAALDSQYGAWRSTRRAIKRRIKLNEVQNNRGARARPKLASLKLLCAGVQRWKLKSENSKKLSTHFFRMLRQQCRLSVC